MPRIHGASTDGKINVGLVRIVNVIVTPCLG